jgi:hypothetical protein
MLQLDAHNNEEHTVLSDVLVDDVHVDIPAGAYYNSMTHVNISSVKYVRQGLCCTCKYALEVALASGS